MKNTLIYLSYECEIKAGQLIAPRQRIKKEISFLADCPEVVMVLKPAGKAKTLQQLRVFHGVIIPQIQDFYMATEGLYKSSDRIKAELKEQFLPKMKRYYDDGSPVIINIAHPTKPGVKMQWHFEETPSLSTLTIDQVRGFIDAILGHFLHEMGLVIEIDPEKRK